MRTYDNPVIGGFHPDPSVCRVGDDYYLACSSFEYFPGVPLFHSRDLVHWRQIGNVLDRPSQLDLPDDTPASAGIYAPTLRHHDGRFYLITTDVGGKGNFLVTADRPEGPWSDPVLVDLPGIDPDLAWDDNGDCWCAVSGVKVARIDPATGKVLEGPLPVWSGTGLQHPEAPHLYRVGDWWYLMLAEGGTAHGHSVSIARARSPRGPYEPAPANPILTHRSTDLPIQSTGHADLVTAPDGTWWMVLLGTRPRGWFPGFHVLGRETFLTPVEWVDGWPRVGPVQEQHPAPAAWHPVQLPPVRDDFDDSTLAASWISPRGRRDDSWSLTRRPGRLTLDAHAGQVFLGRRQQHPDCRAAVRLDPGSGRAGLSVRMDDAHHYGVEVAGGVASVVVRIGPVRQVVAEQPVPPGPVTLAVDIGTAGVGTRGPDTLAFSVEGPQGAVEMAKLDGRYLSTQVAGGFTGRVIGMYVTEGAADFDWFDYEEALGKRTTTEGD
ncbi:glycoside hydrolase family 43 protein [Streptomyces sp. MBT65]|uniref:glycoside hydrolase family 43 protein n=1 Tax=Streptomyces sp. MBT65 TaxID=1488395 RepID=UPI00190A66EC|nr:glycoside hydrolase family 43 protein [Streptomyces sp. MBT65]MBK3577009.1 glycoside hydrolase family 43 protein [Streptomyces sp. MBT65]